jgi:hypothetical protein
MGLGFLPQAKREARPEGFKRIQINGFLSVDD